MNMLQKRVNQRGQGGFTLIELLVVIAILAILAGVVVFAVGNSASNAEISSCKTERASIITAVAAAKAEKLADPSSTATYTSYLESGLKYFVANGTAFDRTPATDTADKAPAAKCLAIT